METALVFDEVYTAHAAFVWRTVRRLGVHPADVPDAAQEVFLVVHRKLAEFEGRSLLTTWLFSICLKVAKDVRGRRQRRREDGEDQLAAVTADAAQVDVVAGKQARAVLERALERLDDDKRSVFVLFELEQLPMNEVAQMLKCPAQTAYARLYAAREIVQASIARMQLTEAR